MTPNLEAFELLADARRRLELDPAAGWRRLTEARKDLGLIAVPGVATSTEQ